MIESKINIIEKYNYDMRMNELQGKYEKSKDWIWALIDIEKDIISPSGDYRFSKRKPKPVPNPIMQWKHPSFEQFIKLCEKNPIKYEYRLAGLEKTRVANFLKELK